MRRPILTLLTALFVAFTVATASAESSVWSALVMANNRAEPTPIPAELNRVRGTLKEFFNYNQYEVIGQSRQSLDGEGDWNTTSKYFSLHVGAKPTDKSTYQLDLQLFQQQKLLLTTEAKLTKSSPLVIRGPWVGDGQLLLLLLLE